LPAKRPRSLDRPSIPSAVVTAKKGRRIRVCREGP